ncbi:hypothetical protein [Mycobacterium spongiae]|uniref:Lipoprotein LppI n=1 Tax=Mycobacterium spongiae TaxID=886343 RepID=A0A975PX51_9MYCO|nr:hypothetical protein [Mycobacterium spongiae]QUR67886.1 hypothetical protein F6B93_12915 [Mycobacterium spongiae]
MRIAGLLAVSLLLAGCSSSGGGDSEQSPASTPSSSASAGAPSQSRRPAPSSAPEAGTAIADVISWIEAGRPADPAQYRTVTRDGVATELGDDIAFSTQDGAVACTTDVERTGDELACLVQLKNPPPRPETAYGEWKGGWVDFDGTKLEVGSARADPGPFVHGNGPALANGDTLSIDDYRCRADQAGLFCVNYAHQSAVRFSSAGIEPFGCLKSVPPPDAVGEAFSC